MSMADDWAPLAEVIKGEWLKAITTARREARNKALEEAAMVADGLGIAYADFALCGIPEQARVREAMNAAAQKISSAIRALKEEG